jgi:hypothetical protein
MANKHIKFCPLINILSCVDGISKGYFLTHWFFISSRVAKNIELEWNLEL